MFKRSFATISLISILTANFLPVFTPHANAQWVVTDPALTAIVAGDVTVRTTKKALDSSAMIVARLAIQTIVNSTVSWAQSGFQGNPAYAVDPKQYFLNLSDNIAGNFIQGNSNLNFLCSPFQTKIRLALRNAYLQEPQYSCSLTGVVQNVDAFYNNFSQGGWDAWFAVTQTSGGNPYDAYLEAKLDLDSRLSQAVGLKQQQLDWGKGFLSKQVCVETSPIQGPADDSGQPLADQEDPACTRYKTVTPGSVISEQLSQVLPSGVNSLISANSVEQLIQAFATGLLNRYVFNSSGGLFTKGSGLPLDTPRSSGSGSGTNPNFTGIDVDGDNKNDIADTDGDGSPDVCLVGGIYPNCTSSENESTTNGVIWGYVFSDTNRNGTKDTGETDLSGISVHIKTSDTSENVGDSSTFNGLYTFSSLDSGKNYIVSIDVPSGQVVTNSNDVSVRAVILTPNRPVLNFGLAPAQ